MDCLNRVRELLQLLTLATENREQVEAALVERIIEEVEVDLVDGGELGDYVSYTQELFEEATAVPFITGIRSSPTILKVAS